MIHAVSMRDKVGDVTGQGLCNCLPKKAFPGYPSAA
jgi:hypothetical protein